MKVQFREWKCEIETGNYSNNRKAITLVEVGTGDPVLTASVNIIDATITSKNHVFIKDYSANSGITVQLIEAGVIEYDITNRFHNGFVEIMEYKLTKKAIKLWKKHKS